MTGLLQQTGPPSKGSPVTYLDLVTALRRLELDPSIPVIAHASLSAFGQVLGGADTMIEALLDSFHSVLVPAFTYRTMLVPESGPADNAMTYGSAGHQNQSAEFFHPDLPVDRSLGMVAEAFRLHPQSKRSMHPILSFCGVDMQPALDAQTLQEPLAPLRVLSGMGGWVLLLGVGQTANTSIHLAERLAGRSQFIRWALTAEGVRECPGFPGCPEGFEALAPWLQAETRSASVGTGLVQAVPLAALIEIVIELISTDPAALLCSNPWCERCTTVRMRLG